MLLNCTKLHNRICILTVFVSLLVDSLHPFAHYLYKYSYFLFYEYKRPSTAFSFNWSFVVCMMNIGMFLKKQFILVFIDNYEHCFFCAVCLFFIGLSMALRSLIVLLLYLSFEFSSCFHISCFLSKKIYQLLVRI